jgi:phage tail-like protein
MVLPTYKYVLPAYNFEVKLDNLQLSFSKIQSIEIGIETEVLMEGGENRFVYSLVKPDSAEKVLIMERGVLSKAESSKKEALRVGTVFTHMVITVLGHDRQSKKMYTASKVLLKKRSLSEFNALNGEVLIESLEFVYRELTESQV